MASKNDQLQYWVLAWQQVPDVGSETTKLWVQSELGCGSGSLHHSFSQREASIVSLLLKQQ